MANVLAQALQRLKRGEEIIANLKIKNIPIVTLRAGDKILLNDMGDVATILGARPVSESWGRKKRYYTIIIYDDYSETIPFCPSTIVQKIID